MTEPQREPSAAPPDTAESIRRTASNFRRLAIIVLAAAGVLVMVTASTMGVLYWAATADVPEYEAVVEVDPAEAETARKQLESQLSTLASDTQQLREWSSRVSAQQINAWLALRLEREAPGFRDAGVLAPRVVLRDGQVMLAARSEANRVDGVVSLWLAPMITDTGDVALDITAAKIGRLSLPLEVVSGILRQTPIGGFDWIRLAADPGRAALVLDLDRLRLGGDRSLRLTGLDVRDGELLLRGESEPVE
ncbi:hypothetical protein [Botrimarina sp.]|uniref:hypothetical protein n=1 Tax=Botrimarina sp. TaxID=2795802 RepID=UPI0032EB9AD8